MPGAWNSHRLSFQLNFGIFNRDPWINILKGSLSDFLPSLVTKTGEKVMKEENRLGKELKLMPETAPKVNSAAPFDHLEEQKMQGALRDSQGDPRKGPQEGWEAQWQEFLRTTQPIQAEWGDAMISEVDPWENAKAFLVSFEQVAKACRWPREEWSTRLLPTLTGEAEQAYRSLETTDREDYGKVKMAILQREALRMEMQRQHFRQFSCQEVEDPHKIYSQVQELCHQWLKPERHSKEQILELLILEQFLASLPPELQVWILAGGPDTCSQAVALAEEFLLSRQVAKTEKWQIAIKETGGGALHKGKKIVTDQKPETALWEVLQEEDENGSALGDENGRQGKGENSVWNGNELEDAPRFISQINQKNVLEAAKKHEGSWRSRNQPWKQPLKRCNDFEQRTIISEKEDGLSNCGKGADWGGNLLKVEKSWCKENQPMDTTEMQAECCDAGEVQEKQPMKAENEVDKLTEGPTTSSKGYPRNEIPLSSLYSRIYQYGSEHATRHILDNPNECPNSVKTAQQNSCCGEHPTMVTGERGNLRCKYTKEGNLSWPQSHHAKEKLNRYPEPGNNIPVREKIKKLQKSKTKMNLYKCTVCSEPFMNKQYLKRTSKVHISEKQYECSLCERTFSRGDHLIRHKKSHEATRPHKCPDCERSFFRKDKLMRHRIMHEGSRVHKCSECDRSFTRRDNMIRHRRTHEGTKYYSCLNVRKFEQPLEQPMTYIDRIVFGNCSPTT